MIDFYQKKSDLTKKKIALTVFLNYSRSSLVVDWACIKISNQPISIIQAIYDLMSVHYVATTTKKKNGSECFWA